MCKIQKFTTMEFNTLKYDQKGNIGILTISRPKALNALNDQFFEEFNSFLDNLPDIRALIITGDGEKSFVAGADIAQMSTFDQKQGYEFSRTGQEAFLRLENLPIPVIAAINGFALGGGLELAASCDIRIASKKAKLGQPEVNLGLIPGYGGTQRLARLIGLGRALYILLSGDMITAEQAYQWGLVEKITEPEDLIQEALKIAQTIASRGKNAVALVKKVTRKGLEMSLEDGLKMEAEEFGKLFNTEETKEGISAFLEKRKPNW